MNKSVEVEGGELAIKNSNGDIAIVPKKHAKEVQKMLSEGCHGCLDNFVSQLPKMVGHASEGTVIPTTDPTGDVPIESVEEGPEPVKTVRRTGKQLDEAYGPDTSLRQNYMRNYDRIIPAVKGDAMKYSIYTDGQYIEEEELRAMHGEVQRINERLSEKAGPVQDAQPTHEMKQAETVMSDGLSDAERVALFTKSAELRKKFEEHPAQRIKVDRKETTWKQEIENRTDLVDPAMVYVTLQSEGAENDYLYDKSRSPITVSGFQTFGQDTIRNRQDEFIKKGYLPVGFGKGVPLRSGTNEDNTGKDYSSYEYTNMSDAVSVANAFLLNGKDVISKASMGLGIELSPVAEEFFTHVAYNAGDGTAKEMMKKYNEMGYLQDDLFMKKNLPWYPEPQKNARQRVQSVAMMKGERLIKPKEKQSYSLPKNN